MTDNADLIEQAFDRFNEFANYRGASPKVADIIAGIVWESIEEVVEEGQLTDLGDIVEEATSRCDEEVAAVHARKRWRG